MAEGQFLFDLDFDRFNEILGQNGLLKLQAEFNRRNTPLSQSLLISPETEGVYWFLADFENKRTYHIRKENESRVEILEGSDIDSDLSIDAGVIVPRLQKGVGTHTGFVNTLQILDFDNSNLGTLKRSDLSSKGLDFESVYTDLEIAYEMLEEILAAPRSALISLPERDVQELKKYILQSYEMSRKIIDFGVGNREKNIREQHDGLSQEIRQFCDRVKRSLFPVVSYLSSRKVEQLTAQVKDSLAVVEERYNTTISKETDNLLKIGEEAQQRTSEMVQKLEETHLKYQNQLTEKPISQYKAIFDNQAKKHGNMAWVWLGITVVLALGSGGIFW